MPTTYAPESAWKTQRDPDEAGSAGSGVALGASGLILAKVASREASSYAAYC